MLNELDPLFSLFLYIGVFTEGFVWVAREYQGHEKVHRAEGSLGSQVGNIPSKARVRLGGKRSVLRPRWEERSNF